MLPDYATYDSAIGHDWYALDPNLASLLDRLLPDPDDRAFAEETGRAPLLFLQRDVAIDTQNPNADGSLNFKTSLNLPPGKHLVYFFQAPDPDPTLTPDEVIEHFRAYANVADTPKSRIALAVPPPRLQFPGRGQVIVQPGPITFAEGNCNPNATAQPPDCALPEADVNIRVGKRVWTARADQNGNWSQTLDLPAGWHKMVISQVVDSRTGGGWQEGCPGDETLAGITRGDAPQTLQLPGFTRVPADGPNGTKIDYPATAMTVTGKPATIDCAPPSGTVFPIGKTLVLCTAISARMRSWRAPVGRRPRFPVASTLRWPLVRPFVER